MNRGCCCCTLETCVKAQGYVVAVVCAGNIVRVLWKVLFATESDSAIKRTSAGYYLDGADFLVNGFGGMLLLLGAILMLRGIARRQSLLLRPYLVVASGQTVALGLYAMLWGVAAAQAIPEPVPDRYPDRAELSVGQVGAIVAAVLLLLIAFPTYFLLNVSSLYHHMKSDSYRLQHFYYIGT